jgi:uncharacterized repeat protein (TIGR04138 family)
MQADPFEEGLERILKKESRYHREAYVFLRDAVNFTEKLPNKEGKVTRSKSERRHVSPEELLHGIRDFALQTYGPMAITLFEEWGIRSCQDFGEIVFIMVENRLLKKTEKDSRSDFENGYDFEVTFRHPYLPASKKVRKVLEAKPTRA